MDRSTVMPTPEPSDPDRDLARRRRHRGMLPQHLRSRSSEVVTGGFFDDAFFAGYPVFSKNLAFEGMAEGRYRVDFARSAAEVDDLLRLRFEVFNLERNEGLKSSYRIGRDLDAHDAVCHHLIVREAEKNRIVGTYRLQTNEMAGRYRGFYSAGEFDISMLPSLVLNDAVEVGRACIAPEHRNGRVLHLLWRGLAHYMVRNRKRHLFGCCSVESQDPIYGRRVMNALERKGCRHRDYSVVPLPGLEAYPEGLGLETGSDETEAPSLGLLGRYLRLGAKVCGPPMIDREFKTLDFFVLLDVEAMAPSALRRYFGA